MKPTEIIKIAESDMPDRKGPSYFEMRNIIRKAQDKPAAIGGLSGLGIGGGLGAAIGALAAGKGRRLPGAILGAMPSSALGVIIGTGIGGHKGAEKGLKELRKKYPAMESLKHMSPQDAEDVMEGYRNRIRGVQKIRLLRETSRPSYSHTK